MSKDLEIRFENSMSRMNKYYDVFFHSVEQEYKENLDIKEEIFSIFIDAIKIHQEELARNVLTFFFENTGCREDYEIAEKVITPYIKKGIISKSIIDKIDDSSPLSRWL